LAEHRQSPETMVIDCCDSRVSPEAIFLMVRCAEHGDVRDRVGEETFRCDLWLATERREQPTVSPLVRIRGGMTGRELRQAVRRCDDTLALRMTKADDEATTVADAKDRTCQALLCLPRHAR
jgi:hypothetical protein